MKKKIDNKAVLTSPQKMMQAIDSNFDELYEGTYVNVKSFGAVGNGTTNDRDAIFNAANSLGPAGGTVFFPPGKYLVDTALTIGNHITLKGTYQFVGTTEAVQHADMSNLILNPAHTLQLGANSGLFGMLVVRKGLTYPAPNDSDFTGTAVTFGGSDCFVHNCRMMGFNLLIYSDEHQRPDIQNLHGDAVNGIEINACWDIARLTNVHMWPFATFYNPTLNDRRSGTAFKFTNGGDWNKVTNCFCWGYFHGFEVDACNSITFLNCGADGPMLDNGTVGFHITGQTTDTRFIGCQAAGQWYAGYYINTPLDCDTRLIDCDAWGNKEKCILIEGGHVSITGGSLRDSGVGIASNSVNSEILIDNVKNVCTIPWDLGAVTKLHMGTIDDGGGWREYDKKSDTVQIAVIGDSLSQAMLFNQTWASQLALHCNQAGLPVEVKNWAVASHTFYLAQTEKVHESNTRTQVEQCIAHGADIIFVALGINDTVHGEYSRTQTQIIDDAKGLYNSLKQGLPNAKIVLIKQDPHDLALGAVPNALANKDCIKPSHRTITVNGKTNCRVNNSTYMNTTIDVAKLNLHQTWGNVMNAIIPHYDGSLSASMWKLSRLGCIVDNYHLDFFGHQLWAFSVLKWLRKNNGFDNKVLDINLWNITNKFYIDVDTFFGVAISNPANAESIAVYHDLDLPQRMSSWFYKHRKFTALITPTELRGDFNMTLSLTGATPNRDVMFGWTGFPLASTGKKTNPEGKYTLTVRPDRVGGLDYQAGTKICQIGVTYPDGSTDVYERTMTMDEYPPPAPDPDPPVATDFGTCAFARKGSAQQTITAADEFIAINWDVSLYSDGHDTATKYTAPYKGIYQFQFNIRYNWKTGTTFVGAALVVNNEIASKKFHTMPAQHATGNEHNHIQVVHSLLLQAGDTVSSRFYQGGASGTVILPNESNYSGYLVRKLA